MTMRIRGGIDLLHIAPFARSGETTPLDARTRIGPAVRIGLAMSILLVGEVALEVGASGDVDVIGTRYGVQRGDTFAPLIEPLIEPLRFRPGLSIGLSTTLAGASRAPTDEES